MCESRGRVLQLVTVVVTMTTCSIVQMANPVQVAFIVRLKRPRSQAHSNDAIDDVLEEW